MRVLSACAVAMTLSVAVALDGCATPDLADRLRADQASGAEAVDASATTPSLAVLAGPLAIGSPDDASRRAAAQSARPVLRRASSPWIGSVSVPMGSGEHLPSIFTEPVRLDFVDTASGGKVSLRTVVDRLTAVTGVPVRVRPDVFVGVEPASRPLPTAPATSTWPNPVPLPSLTGPGATPAMASPPASPTLSMATAAGSVARETSVGAVAMRWSGTLEGYLDLVTDQLGLSWEYRDGVVVIERLRTEFFEIATLDGETDYHLGLSGADPAMGGTGGSQASAGGGAAGSGVGNDVAEHGKANAIVSILAAITQMLHDVPGSSAVRTEGSGRIAVTTTKETMSKVRDFIRAENESLLRQAQIQFDIYSVTRDESDERGIEWSAVLTALGNAYSGSFASPATLASTTAGNVGFTILTPTQSGVATPLAEHLGGSAALVKLLNQFGTSTQHRQVSLLALNRTWDRKSSLGGRAYVSATTPGAATTAGVGAPGLVTSTVTTGDRYLAQPFILDNNTVVLKFGIGLSSLVNLANFTSGTGLAQQTVQTPETTAINDQATVALKAGQVLVITGLSRAVANDDRRTLTEDTPIGLGGSRARSRQREDFVIFVRPTLM